MKTRILQDLNSLVNAQDLEERVNLQIKVSHLIQVASLGLDPDKEVFTKKEILDNIKNFVETPHIYKEIICAHVAYLEAQDIK